jgi:hypothetical protein
MWKELEEENKKKYHDQAEKEKVRYLLELNSFYQSHPFEIIQNKTKKNHVKKPCSAYALYLKEQKQIIKSQNPSLKMADILKIVGDKWKNLAENEKSKYQNEAQKEKEKTKAILNEHMIESTTKNPIPQKRVQNQKRIQKALKKENIKTEPFIRDLPKIEYDDLKREEEPAMMKKQMIGGASNINMMEMPGDSFFPELLANISKFSIPEIISRAASNKEQPEFVQDANYLMNLLDTTKRFGEKSTELLLDYFTFQSRQESNANRCMPQGTVAPVNRNQAINETLMNCLQLDSNGDFNLDAFNVKLSSLVCKSIE